MSKILFTILDFIYTFIIEKIIQALSVCIKYIFRKILAKKRTRFSEAKTFIIGNRTTSVIVIDGDGQTEFNDKNINIFATECCPFEIPEEVQECYKNTVLQLKKMKEKGKNVPWNGSTLSLYKYTISRTANYEDYKIDIFLSKCDYYMTYSTIHNLDVGEKTLRSKYIETYNFENNEIYLLVLVKQNCNSSA